MKGKRGKAKRVVVPGQGRCVRLSGGEKRRKRHLGRAAAWSFVETERRVINLERHAKRVLEAGDGMAPPLPRSSKEKHALRARKAMRKYTPTIFLGKS